MNRYISTLLMGSGLLCLSACSDEELMEYSVVEHSRTVITVLSDLDYWIYQHYTRPYNIEVVYKWERHTSTPNAYAYPPREDKVKEVLETLQSLWIELYQLPRTGGEDYLKGKAPLRIYLLGGRNLDARGIELIASPKETAGEMYIYNVNDFDKSDPDRVFVLMRSVLHQFALRLMELYPPRWDAFASIAPERYVDAPEDLRPMMSGLSSQRAIYELQLSAHRRSFVTLHAMLSARSEMAEIASSIITHTPRQMAEAEAGAFSPERGDTPEEVARYAESAKRSGELFVRKRQLVEEYYRDTLGIPLQFLQQAYLQRSRVLVSTQSTDQ